MNLAGTVRHATDSQIRLILRLTGQDSLDKVETLEDCPPVERYRTRIGKRLDNRTAARLIDELILWKELNG